MRNSRHPHGWSRGAWTRLTRDGLHILLDDARLLPTRMLGMEHQWVGVQVGCA